MDEALYNIKQSLVDFDEDTLDYGFSSTIFFSTVLNSSPIIRIDPALDPLIIDTNISEKSEVKIPYPAMFIDKVFKSGENKYILGIALYDVVFIETWLKNHTISFENYRIKIDEEDKLAIYDSDVGFLIPLQIEDDSMFSNEIEKMMFSFLEAEVKEDKISLSFILISIANALDLLKGKRLPESEISYDLTNLDNTDDKDLLKDVIRYVFNICFLVNNHVDKVHPATHKNDIRMVPYYPDAKSRRGNVNRYHTIKVFGEMKKYVDNYNRERRKYNKTDLDAVLVRGHWRHLQSERYIVKRGETIWIAPFIKGTDKELYKRVVRVTP